ncbi:unnamed protein product [Effrenium voratum]|uniref:SEC7 domain-containing protein n=1 Tax=Effrenium voratum TaxID=2562239 RepID=A0AA36I091_9DINO|nr:unnamed protein product [Effrenium voratum]
MGASQGLTAICQPCYTESCCDDDTLDEKSTTYTRPLTVHGFNVLSFGPGSGPAGQVFEETLRGLNRADRNLLQFAATSCLVAVRWLVYHGASPDVHDANGTTALHVACRSGSLPLVCEVLKFAQLLEAVDIAGWTPLHIAGHMGRSEAVRHLLQARASPHRRNAAGQTPAQISLDRITREVLQAAAEDGDWERGMVSMAEAEQEVEEGPEDYFASFSIKEDRVGVPNQCERELFFVTPKASIKEVTTFRKSLMKLLVLLFNLKPSAGLAFAVACGLSESYGAAARALLHTEGADKGKIGNFLGQDFSLCLLVRFGVLDSLPLLCTGVISCLEMSFSRIQLPEDMDRMERLLHAAALVWWRKHRALSPSMLPAEGVEEKTMDTRELVGHGLLQYISSAQVLSQLMFSTVMLHAVIHGDGSAELGDMSFEDWAVMNKGLEDVHKDIPEFVQRPIYDAIRKKFVPELCVAQSSMASPSSRGQARSRMGSDSSDEFQPYGQERQSAPSPGQDASAAAPSAFHQIAQAEGWVQLNCHLPIVGSSQIRPGSETLGTEAEVQEGFNALMKVTAGSDPPGPPEHGWVWASLCSICLLFSSMPPGKPAGSEQAAPHAVVDVRLLHVTEVSRETLSLTVATFSAHPYRPKTEGAVDDSRALGDIPVVLLMEDGRFQELNLPPLQMKVESEEELDLWVGLLAEKNNIKLKDGKHAITLA